MKIINTGTGKNHKRQESWNVIKGINDIFLEKRKSIIRLPPKGSNVLACFSGGLDSTTNIAILMEEFRYKVYPYFINRGQSNLKYELEAVDWYNKYFKKRYPLLYNESKEIKIEIPSKSYKNELRVTKHLQDNLLLRKRNTYPARNPVMFLAGMEYGYSLESKGVKIHTHFISEHADDFSVHGSLTLVRTLNLDMCWLLNDWSYQFISIPIEQELDNYYGKDIYVKWADKHNLPLEYTRSCCSKDKVQCGVCTMACYDRRMAFKKAGIKDKTKYQFPFPDKKQLKEDTAKNWNGVV